MTDTSTAESRKVFWWLAGRAGRAEYWASIGLIFAVSILISFTPLASASSALIIALLFVEMRRVHDFGRSAWWAVAAVLVPGVIMLAWMTIASLDTAFLVAMAVQLALMIWIGVIRGDPGENRFGPAPPFTWKRVLTGR